MPSIDKLDRIIRVLKDNRGKWLSASEIAGLCKWKYLTTQDVRANLKDDDLPNIERKNFSTNMNQKLKYRYMEATK